MSTVIWTPIVAGVMTDLQERKLYGARVSMYGAAVIVYWTLDGTTGTASVFDANVMPMVDVVAEDPSNPQAWTNTAHWGPMLRQDIMANMAPYSWVTTYDSGNALWQTAVGQNTLPEAAGTRELAGTGGSISKRSAFLYAMGT